MFTFNSTVSTVSNTHLFVYFIKYTNKCQFAKKLFSYKYWLSVLISINVGKDYIW